MDTHIHSVSKHDLIVAYFPELNYTAAGRKFRRWINGNPHLLERLKTVGYKISQKKLSISQLRVLFRYFGPPETDIFSKRAV